jgi:hypothetical protein
MPVENAPPDIGQTGPYPAPPIDQEALGHDVPGGYRRLRLKPAPFIPVG